MKTFAQKLRDSMLPPPPPHSPASLAAALRHTATVLSKFNTSKAMEKIPGPPDERFIRELEELLVADGWRTIHIDRYSNVTYVAVTW